MTDVLDPHHSPHPTPAATRPPRRRWSTIAIVLAALLVAAALPAYWLIELYRANWGVVVPGQIYRSAQMTPLILRGKLEENHINVILFLSHDDDQDSDFKAEKRIAAAENVQFLNFPMMGDGVAAPSMYTEALLALCDALRDHKAVLVHCHSGAQRTGGVVAVYRMLVQKMPPDQALAEMRRYGHDPHKNLTLVPFINEHIGEWAAALVKEGVIDRVPDPLPKLVVN